MKNLLVKISLIAIMAVACNTASAVYSDSTKNYALWHCDATNWAGATETTPDDNSSGRTAKNLIINAQNEATMMPGSPYGGSYLAFDGTDHATAWAVFDTQPTDYLNIDLSFRANAFPAAGKYVSLLWASPIRTFLYDGAHVRLLMFDASVAGYFLDSTKTINADTWYSVTTVLFKGTLYLTVGNDAEGYVTDSRAVGAGLLDVASYGTYACPGWDPQDTPGERKLNGDLDEIRISLPSIINEYYSESTIAELPFQPQPNDLAQQAGSTESIVSGGMHGATPDAFPYLFNSDAVGSYGPGGDAIFQDGMSPGADTEFNCNFDAPKSIGEIRVFTHWGDQRVFSWFEVWASTTGTAPGDYTYLGTATLGELGQANTVYIGKECLARLYNPDDGVLAINVTSLKLIQKNCGYGISAGLGDKLAPGTAQGSYVSIVGTVSPEIDIIGVPEEPVTQVSGLAYDDSGDTSIELSWDDGNGDGRLIICGEGSTPSSDPADWTDYAADSTFGSGASLGDGFVVYKGSGNPDPLTIDDLKANTDYYFQAFEYNGDVPNYNTDTATDNPIFITTAPEPGMFLGIIVFGLSIIRIKQQL